MKKQDQRLPAKKIPIVFQDTGKASAPLIRGAPLYGNRAIRYIGEQRTQADHAVQIFKDDGYRGANVLQNGFSLVELMVAIMIGLLVILVATTGVSFYEANRRTSMGVNSAEENALAAVYAIQGDARQAGFGSNMPLSPVICPNIQNPVMITKDPAAVGSDILLFTYLNALDPVTSRCGVPTTYTYRVFSTKLQRSSDGGVNYEDLAENIVQMRAQYGINVSSPSTTEIEKWANALPDKALALAIRYVIVARSSQLEKLSSGRACTAQSTSGLPTTVVPSSGFNLSAADDPVILDFSATPDWQCYSYRVVSLTVPLKNILIQKSNAI